jgi:hypothetical protein
LNLLNKHQIIAFQSFYVNIDNIPNDVLTTTVKQIETQLRKDILKWKEMK